MDYSMLLFYGLVDDLYSSRGSGEIDRLSDDLLQDIGYKRVGGRVIKDEEPSEASAVRRRSWFWPTFGAKPATPRVSQHSARLA